MGRIILTLWVGTERSKYYTSVFVLVFKKLKKIF
jgi:hypothetical protein